MASTTDRILGLLRSLAGSFLKPGSTKAPPRPRPGTPGRTRPAGGPASAVTAQGLAFPYPGDFHGTSRALYAPKPDGAPDPGEIVWTWVPFEEDYSQGKDRPVLVVGRAGKHLLALMLTSKDHSGDRRGDDDYVDLGNGPWDRQGRPSEAKLDRILQVNEADIRREGAVLDAKRFGQVADGLRARHGWS
ncbi:type II toxin-antitoxin system PemK/MazF family toxin [Arthrobacter livingstonensis]|uniref:Type II toxin-antitoxin system PemK/MazF family toxin n=1 Tax=Arthrobacter livingstonensis TaxID=670078 RepID=A0A2V5L817_9MICC|nr:type II toxin-antitoxin system PemK/MazF family toxin [Arthrobacter livingstonensis]PYI67398.1 type II toxin-antitoxin system PemK/MazF family toxin [Arthrobacter livingstonensis]